MVEAGVVWGALRSAAASGRGLVSVVQDGGPAGARGSVGTRPGAGCALCKSGGRFGAVVVILR